MAPKTNGIGSKNFGLRSLFIFGDTIYVRSGGYVALLNLPTLETGRDRDSGWWGGPGVRLKIPYRSTTFGKLEPFTIEEEKRAFEAMADGMLATLVKLALAGRKPGLQKLTLRSVRYKKTLVWRQKAETIQCHIKGVSALLRTGRLKVQHEDQAANSTRTFEELEFTRAVEIPAEYAGVPYPDYYRKTGGRIAIGISVPIVRKHIDLTKTGNFYYPLLAPDSSTGYPVSVSAPFDLDNDRSSLQNNSWNRWLISQAASLTIDLLKGDWFRRFGPDAYKALIVNAQAKPNQFAEAIARHLSEDECWPNRERASSTRYMKAPGLVLCENESLDGFLSNSCCLDKTLQRDGKIRELAKKSRMLCFTISSLIHLRCVSKDDAGTLQTKIEKGEEACYYYTNYVAALSDPTRQEEMASALTAVWKHVPKTSREDLRSSRSTLTATGDLRPAKELVCVAPDIWEICPEPVTARLHPSLVPHHAIAGFCITFDEQEWIVRAANRACDGQIEDKERETLYAKLLTGGVKVGRRALAALKDSPVTKNQRGEWTAPSAMVMLKGTQAKLMSPAVSMPSRELLKRPGLCKQLRIRNRLNGDDILAYARSLSMRPKKAQQFESFLQNHRRLLTRPLVDKLKTIPFLRSRAGELACPVDLHLDTSVNRGCLNNDRKIVGGSNKALYQRLLVRETPMPETLLKELATYREQSIAPPAPDAFYAALAAATRERSIRAQLAAEPILWVGSGYYSPREVLVGVRIPQLFDGAVPILRQGGAVAQAYLDLGASGKPNEGHWIRFFEHVAETFQGTISSQCDRNILIEAYHRRGDRGLPEDLDERVCCLLDRQGRLFSLFNLRSGLLVEGDYPALADALRNAGSTIGVVDLTEKSRAFYIKLGIRPLSSIAGVGTPIFGNPVQPPLWVKPEHRDHLLASLHKPIFSKALYELAVRQRHAMHSFHPIAMTKLQSWVNSITRIDFFDTISREYHVGGLPVRVSVDTAIQEGVIGLVRPRTKLVFEQLVVQSLAYVAGAGGVAQERVLSNAFLPLLTACRNAEDMNVYLEWMGVDIQGLASDPNEDLIDPEDTVADTSEEIVRQLVGSLISNKGDFEEIEIGLPVEAGAGGFPERPMPTPPSSSPPTLPNLNDVTVSFAENCEQQLQLQAMSGIRTGSAHGWVPRNAIEQERDRLIGQRGEELVYRMELERIQAMGHKTPEDIVTWSSRNDPGSDHDIRSTGEDGRIRWIEVKATTGTDGGFNWSRKEFEKALREGACYELWRVYRADTTNPVVKCFVNPIAMLARILHKRMAVSLVF